MSDILIGDAAVNAMEDNGEEESAKDFTSFKVGSKYIVKVIGPNDFFGFYKYGIYNENPSKRINSFVAKNPSKKSAKGYPVENLTSWDKAWKYHADKSKEFGDKHSQEAYKYKPELRYAMGFFDLDSGERIVIDVSKKQANTLRSAIEKYKSKLNRLSFELTKAQGGVVSLSPVIDMEEDLTDKQKENFENAPEEFNIEEFTGILYEADDDEMLELLVKAGFDVTLIGLEPPKKDGSSEEVEPVEDSEEEDGLPF